MRYQGINIDFKDRTSFVGIIGSRKANKDELNMAYHVSKKLAAKGYVIVSGLAEGIDTYAHRGALAASGKTIAVLSTSLSEAVFPSKNKELSEKIRIQGGLLYPFEEKANSKDQRIHRLLERDILLSFLCPKIIIVKDDNETIDGGTKWATNYGYVFNRKVFRVDASGKFHENPEVKTARAMWAIESDFVRNVIQKSEN